MFRYLYENKFTGTLPVEISEMRSLRELRLDSNSLEGTVPPAIAAMPNLTLMYSFIDCKLS